MQGTKGGGQRPGNTLGHDADCGKTSSRSPSAGRSGAVCDTAGPCSAMESHGTRVCVAGRRPIISGADLARATCQIPEASSGVLAVSGCVPGGPIAICASQT
jgi:hypothetical protein